MREALTRWCLDLQAHTGLSSIVLGGRRAWQESAVESKASDVDLYAFCGDGLYARMPRLADTLRGAGVRRVVRERSAFLELHYVLTDLPEIDLKVMRWSTVDAVLAAPPNLDELYLEKMHSLHHYRVIIDDSGDGLRRIDRAARRRPADLAALLPYAFESYVKHAWGVAKQGLRRGEPLVGSHLARRALDHLVLVEYLLNDTYPPPFKWRMHDAALAGLRRGDLIRSVATTLEFAPGLSLSDHADGLRALEAEILSDPGAAGIPGRSPDAWWWAP
ncbi:hypothetical protein [Streptomyces sp. NPDC090036]|uniref:hypothetical protein n=1 Tax=Streptomyces sp. NPDC090036 TaxID=3365926 RepID=UPI0038192A60